MFDRHQLDVPKCYKLLLRRSQISAALITRESSFVSVTSHAMVTVIRSGSEVQNPLNGRWWVAFTSCLKNEARFLTGTVIGNERKRRGETPALFTTGMVTKFRHKETNAQVVNVISWINLTSLSSCSVKKYMKSECGVV